jgi:HPr kinase/phosphorylase
MKVKPLLLSRVFGDCRDLLSLEGLNRDADLGIEVKCSEVGVPGLALSGFEEGFKEGSVQVLGETEISYLSSLTPEEQVSRFQGLLKMDIPCVIVAGPRQLDACSAAAAGASRTPVFTSPLSSTQVIHYLSSYLEVELAPETGIHGTLVDVYGVGILLRGKSGIGKSECALDLVERGHRLVADDLVRTIAKPPGILVGRSSEHLQNYVEVRGVGIIDIGSIYGIRALRRQKRIEVEVNLKEWEKGLAYDRSGLESAKTEILGVKIPSVTVPLVPGKSVSVIVEVIALGHILRAYGYDAAAALDERWLDKLRTGGRRAFEPRDIE